MARHFLVPATIAAIGHGLLFGIPGGDAPVRVAAVRSEENLLPLVPMTPPDPVEVTNVASASSGAASEAPQLPERPTVDTNDGIRIPVQIDPPSRAETGPILELPRGRVGLGGGDGPDGRPSILSSAHLDRTPNARVQVAPQYPHSARQGGLEGEVIVEFVVDENGRVRDPRVVKSTYTVFEDAAIRAVEKWIFQPGTHQGRPVRFRMALPVVFRLDT